jgi:hypothetical protein
VAAKRTDLKILTDLHILSPSEYKRGFFGMSFVCLSGWMCASLVPELLEGLFISGI